MSIQTRQKEFILNLIPLGLFQLGPAPLKAVKEGNVDIKFDARFVFAEVNADTVYWKRDTAGGSFKPFEVDKKSIGEKMIKVLTLISVKSGKWFLFLFSIIP